MKSLDNYYMSLSGSVKLQSPHFVPFLCCDMVITNIEVRVLLFLLGQIVTLQPKPKPIGLKLTVFFCKE